MLMAHLEQQLAALEQSGLRRRRRTVQLPCGPQQQLAGQAQPRLSFCSNDYLGLAAHLLLAQALTEGGQRWGVGSGASHLVSGHYQVHEDVEQGFARWQQAHIPQAEGLLFCSGFMANMALMMALGDGQTTIFSDKLNHASLIDGARLSGCDHKRYPHADAEAAARQLAAHPEGAALLVSDGVFSMDGDLAPLHALAPVAREHGATVYIDEAHAVGVLGDA